MEKLAWWELPLLAVALVGALVMVIFGGVALYAYFAFRGDEVK